MPPVSGKNSPDERLSSDIFQGRSLLQSAPLKHKRGSSFPKIICKKDALKSKHKKKPDYYAKKLMKLQFWSPSNIRVNLVRSGSHLDTELYHDTVALEPKSETPQLDLADVEDNDIADDEDDIEKNEPSSMLFLNKLSNFYPRRIGLDENIERKVELSPLLATSDGRNPDFYSSRWRLNRKFKDIFSKRPTSFAENTDLNNQAALTSSVFSSSKDILPSASDFECDLVAREKVLQYINETIDELWARFCDCSTLVEEEIHTSETKPHNSYSHVRSLSNDYTRKRRNTLISSNFSNDVGVLASELEGSAYKLGHLRDRLTKYKKEMENIIDSFEMEDIERFWFLWDNIKWDCVNLMESEEDDNDISESNADFRSEVFKDEKYESVVAELESRRVF